MMLGFFMILVDSTIVSVAIPAITADLGATYNEIIWVNSSYLLAYAVPLLITGRLGDRFGPRTIYLIGLALFTASSLACGFSNSAGQLIAARAFQGLGGAMVTPQSMSVMIRTFSPRDRGSAMGVWGATAGLATITGPLLGGVLVDAAGWPWIFYVNVPIGIIALVLAFIHVPVLERTNRRFDWIGMALSAVAMFCVVFGIQEASNFSWDWRVWLLLAIGAAIGAVFFWWQGRRGTEALVPLQLFDDRNFTLAGITIATVGFAVSTFMIPWMIYVQTVREFTPTHAALLILPSGLISGFLSPWIGKLTNTHDPKPFAIAGLSVTAATILVSASMTDLAVDPRFMYLASVFYGVGNSMMWGPLSMVATRNLNPRLAGAGSSVYNTLRQIGAVIGSAAIAAMMSAQLNRELGAAMAHGNWSGNEPGAGPHTVTGPLPEALQAPFTLAMSHTILLPGLVIAAGAALACFFAKTKSWES